MKTQSTPLRVLLLAPIVATVVVSCLHVPAEERQPAATGSARGAASPERREVLTFDGMIAAIEKGLAASNEPQEAVRIRVNRSLDRGTLGDLIRTAGAAFRTDSNIRTGRLLIECYKRDLSIHKALEIHRQLLQAHPHDVDLQENYAEDLGLAGGFAEAADLYRRLATTNSLRRRDFLLAAAELCRRAGRYAAAEADIDNALSEGSPDAAAFRAAARLHELMGNPRKSLQIYRTALRLLPTDCDLNRESAERCRAVGFRAEADACYAAALDQTRRFMDRVRLLEKLHGGGGDWVNPRTHVREYSDRVNANPRDSEARASLAILLVLDKDAIAAIETIESGLKLLPQDVNLLLARAHVHGACGEFRQAVGKCRSLLDLANVDRQAVLEILGGLYSRWGRPEDARTVWEQIPNLEKQAELLEQHRMTGAAEGIYRKLVASQPLNRAHYQSLERLLIQNGKTREAIDVLRCLLVLDPDDLSSIRSLGRLYLQTGERNKAVETGRRILSIHTRPETPKVDDSLRDGWYRQYWASEGLRSEISPFVRAFAFFTEDGLEKEFLAILDQDLRDRPDDLGRALAILPVFESAGEPARASVLIRRLLNGPPLETALVPACVRKNGKSSREDIVSRLAAHCGEAAMRNSVMAEYRTTYRSHRKLEHDYDYLVYAELLRGEGKSEEALAVVDAGLAEVRDSMPLRWARALLLPQPDKKAEELEGLLDHCADPRMSPGDDAGVEDRLNNILYQLPVSHRALVTETDKDIMRRALAFRRTALASQCSLTETPSRAQCVCKMADAWYAVGNRDKARQALGRLLPRSQAEMADWGDLADICSDHGDEDMALQVLESQQAHRAYVKDALSPLLRKGMLGFMERFSDGGSSGTVQQRLAEFCLKKKDYVRAYEVRRSGVSSEPYNDDKTDSGALYALVSRYRVAPELIAFYTRRLEAATEKFRDFEKARNGDTSLARRVQGQRLRNEALDEGYKLAEIYQFQDRYQEAAATYRKLLALDPGDGAVLGCLRILAMKEQDFGSAVLYQEKLLQLYQRMVDGLPGNEDETYPDLAPFNPRSDRDDWDDTQAWGHHAYSTLYREALGNGPYLESVITDEIQRYAAIFIKAGKKDEAARSLQLYARKANLSPGCVFRMLTNFAERCGLREQLLPALRELVQHAPRDYELKWQYLDWLIGQKKFPEAVEFGLALKRDIPAWPSNRDALNCLDESLTTLGRLTHQNLTAEPDTSLEAIRKTAQESPDDPDAQLRLLKFLWRENKLDEALVVTEAVRAMAGHHPENEDLRGQILRRLGKDTTWLREREQALARLNPDERSPVFDQLIEYFYERDDLKRVAKLCEQRIIPGNLNSHLWTLRALETLGRYDRMPAVLKAMAPLHDYSFDRKAMSVLEVSILLKVGRDREALAIYEAHVGESAAKPYWAAFWQQGKLDLVVRAIDKAVADSPDDLSALRQKCALAEFLGQRDEEMRLSQLILQKDSSDPEADRRIYQFMRDKGDYEWIEARARQALAAEPRSAHHRRTLAELMLRKGRKAEALECLRDIYEKGKPETALDAARELEASGFHAEARAMFSLYMESGPTPSPGLFDFAISLFEGSGNLSAAYDMAAERHRLYLSRNSGAEYEGDEVSSGPFDRDLWRLAGKAGKTDAYLKCLKELAARDSTRVAVQLELATAYVRANQRQEYRQWLQQLVRIFPRNMRIRQRLLLDCELDEDWHQCIALLEDQMAQVPGPQRDAKAKIGRYYEYLGEFDKAERQFTAVAEEANDASSYAWLARWHLGLGRLDKGRQMLAKALQLDESADLTLDYAGFLARNGEVENAIRTYHRAIKQGNRDVRPANDASPDSCVKSRNGCRSGHRSCEDAGVYLALKRLYARSPFVQETTQALQKSPDDRELLRDMIIIKDVFGADEEAYDLRRRLFNREPASTSLLEGICRHLERSGQYAEALPYCERVLRAAATGEDQPGLGGKPADPRLRVATIHYQADKDLKKAMSHWKYFLIGTPESRTTWSRAEAQRFLLNLDLPKAVIGLPGERLIFHDGYGSPPPQDTSIDFQLAIALLETGQFHAVEDLLARRVCLPKLTGAAARVRSGEEDPRLIVSSLRLLDADGQAFYEACRRSGCAGEIVGFLEKAFAAHKGQSLHCELLSLAAFHYRRNRQYNRVEDLIRTYAPSSDQAERHARARALASVAVERGDWQTAVEHLRTCLVAADARSRRSILMEIANLYEEKACDGETALALYRECDALDTEIARGKALHGNSEEDNATRAEPDEYTEGSNIEDDGPTFFADASLNVGENESFEIARRTVRVPDERAERLVGRDLGSRRDILRLLLKLKRVEEAAALENELLAVFSSASQAMTPPQAIRIWLLEQVAEIHAQTGDYGPAIGLHKQAHVLEMELLNGAIKTQRRRAAMLRTATVRHIERIMELALKAGMADEYLRAVDTWKPLQIGECERARIQGNTTDCRIRAVISSLVDLPAAFVRPEGLAEAERLLRNLDEPANPAAKLLEASICLRRNQIDTAQARCEQVVALFDKEQASKRRRDRYFGNTSEVLEYRKEPDALLPLDPGDLLLIAQVCHAAGNAELAKRAILLAETKDQNGEHWRWRDPGIPAIGGGR